MDTNISSVQRSPTKRSKPKKKKQPIKVVYISNPMKVNTSASQFRALVQELTGQYAESPPDPSRFQVVPGADDSDGGRCRDQMEYSDKNDNVLVVPPPVDPVPEGITNGGSSSMESFDYVFTPQMVDNISALLDHW